MDNTSAKTMWENYKANNPEKTFTNTPEVYHFCDNEKDANQCVKLVKKGIKQATSDSLLGLQYRNKKLPKMGDFAVITNWDGNAECIIELRKITLKPFFSIDETYARLEGEGDKSLAHWKKVHWEYYTRELAAFERLPRESMIVVCQEFVKVH